MSQNGNGNAGLFLKGMSRARRIKKDQYELVLSKTGAAGRNRTHDPLVRSQVLYPVELLALMEVPVGFEPTVIELQSIALPTWLRNHHKHCNYTLLLGIFQVF